jgi:prepilin-type N-terminal cleavage/methylation domain-containing protein
MHPSFQRFEIPEEVDAGMSRFTTRRRKGGFTLIEIMIVVLIIGILLAIAVPNFMKARESSRTKACVANLKQIDAAIEQWAMDNKKAGGDAVVIGDLTGGAEPYLTTAPECPSGGAYAMTTVNANPTCSLGGTHILP